MMKLYNDIGQLLKDYRDLKNLTQSDLADILGVEVRSIRRWERLESPLKIDSEKSIVHSLRIPFMVVHSLNGRIPVSFNLMTLRYEMSEFAFQELSTSLFFTDLPNKVNNNHIKELNSKEEIQTVLDYDQGIYNAPNNVKFDVLKKAAELLPELNMFVSGALGYHAGHLAVLPLKMDIYENLKTRSINEGSITTRDIIRPSNDTSVSLYIYSMYCESIEISRILFPISIRNYKALRKHILNPQSFISGFAVTLDGNEIATRLKMRVVFKCLDDKNKYKTECVPNFFEISISDFPFK